MWLTQFGSSGADMLTAVAVDSNGDVICGGATNGALTGTSSGGYDAWIAKFDSTGDQVWIKQFNISSSGTSDDYLYALAVDSNDRIICGGTTSGSLGGTNANTNSSAWSKFDSAGDRRFWITQLDTVRPIACELWPWTQVIV